MDNAILQELVGKVCVIVQSAGMLAEEVMVDAVSDRWIRAHKINKEVRIFNTRQICHIDIRPEKVQIKWREKL